ncbi:MAG: hypothetical protein LBS12_05540 [Prevotellaceae bacterium]|jgi:hypothetical protein|nr:hypothetical protein [Prevotellaceae bacterium]
MKSFTDTYRLAGFFLSFFVAATTALAAGQYGYNPDITNYRLSQYRAADQNWAVTQDGQGIIYVANNGGLLEFDGVHWTLHKLPGCRRVRTVIYDSLSQRIYCGAFEQFGYWERNAFNDLEYHSVSDSLTSYSLHNDDVWSIILAGDTVIFRSFVACFAYSDGQPLQVTVFPSSCLAMEKIDNRLYAATIDGLYVCHNGRVERLPGGEQFTGTKQIAALLPFDRRRMLIATQHDGLYLYDGRTYTPWPAEADRLLRDAQINRALVMQDSIYIFGTILNGVIAIDRHGRQQWHLHKSNGLQNNTVLGLCCDREGNIWLALDRGIDCIAVDSPLHFYYGHYDNVESVYAVMEHAGMLYLGTNRGLYARAPGEAHFTIVPETQGQVWGLSVWDGQLLCGHNAGTFRIEGRRAIPVSNITGGYCLRLFTPSDGEEVLLQSTYTKLVIYKKNRQAIWQYAHTVPDFIEPVRYLEIDRLGNIWAGHIEKGLFRLRLNPSLTAIDERKSYTIAGHAADAHIQLFKVNNRMVFATGRQLYTYDDIRDSIVPYDRLNQTLGKFAAAHKIIPARPHQYWFVCRDEWACIAFDNAENGRIVRRISHHALKGQAMTYNECIYTNNRGLSFIGLNRGFALLDGNQPKRPRVPAAILLRTIEACTTRQQYIKLAPGAKQASLPASYGSLRFIFAYPSFSPAGEQLYYKLEGLENDWSPAPANYEKEYSRLPPGKYVFALKAIDGNGDQIAQTAYRFVIAPPWYAGHAAYIGYGIAGLCLLLVAYGVGRARLRRQHQKIMQQEEKRQQEELQRKEQKIIKLKNEKLEADVLYKAKELAVSAMAIIQKNNVLETLKQELQKNGNTNDKSTKNIIKLINQNLSTKKDWEVFEANFDLIHDRFFRNLKKRSSQLTSHDLKLCAYLRLNLSTKEIAQLLGNSVRGVEVARYRLRKKLQLAPDENLNDFILEFKG